MPRNRPAIPGRGFNRRRRTITPAPIRSTFPFTDGFPWDEELIRAGQRAVSTHGVYPVTIDDGWREDRSGVVEIEYVIA